MSKVLSISPTEVLKMSEFDTSVLLEGMKKEGIIVDEKDPKIDIGKMTDSELEQFKQKLLSGVDNV